MKSVCICVMSEAIFLVIKMYRLTFKCIIILAFFVESTGIGYIGKVSDTFGALASERCLTPSALRPMATEVVSGEGVPSQLKDPSQATLSTVAKSLNPVLSIGVATAMVLAAGCLQNYSHVDAGIDRVVRVRHFAEEEKDALRAKWISMIDKEKKAILERANLMGKYLGTLMRLHKSHIVITGELVKHLSIDKALDEGWVRVIIRLHKSGIVFSRVLVKETSIKEAHNKTWVWAVEKSFQELQIFKLDSNKSSFDPEGFAFGTRRLLQSFTVVKASNPLYVATLIRENGNIDDADEKYLEDVGKLVDLLGKSNRGILQDYADKEILLTLSDISVRGNEDNQAKARQLCMTIARAFPNRHPKKYLFYRCMEIGNGTLIWKDIEMIYENFFFLLETSQLNPTNQFSIARAIELLLRRFDLTITDTNIEKALPFILDIMVKYSEQIVLNKNTSLMTICHSDEVFEPFAIALFAADYFGVLKEQQFKGPRHKQAVLNAIKEAPLNSTIWLNGHGGPNHFWLAHGKPGNEESTQEGIPDAIHYKELADALSARAQNALVYEGGDDCGNLSDLAIVVDACFSADFLVNLLNELLDEYIDGRIKNLPLVIAVTNRGAYSYTPKFLEGLIIVSQNKNELVLADIFRAEEYAVEYEDFSVFLPLTADELRDLKNVLGVTEQQRIGASRDTDRSAIGYIRLGSGISGERPRLVSTFLPVVAGFVGKLTSRDGKILTGGFILNRFQDHIAIEHPDMDEEVRVDIATDVGDRGVITKDAVIRALDLLIEQRRTHLPLDEQEKINRLIERLKTTAVKEIVTLKHHDRVKGIFGADNVIYLNQGLIYNSLSLLHELGEGFIELPKYGYDALTRHTFMRGVGKDVRNAFDEIEEGITEEITAGDIIDLLEATMKKQDFAMSSTRSKEDPLTASEKDLIRYNYSRGYTGKRLLYGLQDYVDPLKNLLFAQQIQASKGLSLPPYTEETLKALEETSGKIKKAAGNLRISRQALHHRRQRIRKVAKQLDDNDTLRRLNKAFAEATLKTLEGTGGNRKKAAEQLNISLSTLYGRIARIRKKTTKIEDNERLQRLKRALISLPLYTEETLRALEETAGHQTNAAKILGIKQPALYERIQRIDKIATQIGDNATLARLNRVWRRHRHNINAEQSIIQVAINAAA